MVLELLCSDVIIYFCSFLQLIRLWHLSCPATATVPCLQPSVTSLLSWALYILLPLQNSDYNIPFRYLGKFTYQKESVQGKSVILTTAVHTTQEKDIEGSKNPHNSS